MNEYIFIFGNTPALALQELQVILNRYTIPYSLQQRSGAILQVSSPSEIDLSLICAVAGGVVKAGKVVAQTDQFNLGSSLFADVLKRESNKKIVFGISSYVPTVTTILELSRSIKELLATSGISSRYILPKSGELLSSVVVGKQQVQELILVPLSEDKLLIAKTQFVQDVDAWSTRDFGRPHADPKKGMLPPKVARMMVNLGVGISNPANCTVADLFCGMGTILSEAVMIGCQNVSGCDISQNSVDKAIENIEFIKKQEKLGAEITMVCGDATHAQKYFKLNTFDCIVTEPYLGPLFEKSTTNTVTLKHRDIDRKKIANIMKGLEKLYIGCLRQWHDLLKKQGVVVIAFPEIQLSHDTRHSFTVKNVIDRCEKLGYTRIIGPLIYSRAHAITKRAIYLFKRK